MSKFNRYREEKATTELILKEMETEMSSLRKENQERKQSTISNNEEVRFEELTRELNDLKEQNRSLHEQNDELQAVMLTRGVEQGINLLNGTSASLAKELEAMGQAQVSAIVVNLHNFHSHSSPCELILDRNIKRNKIDPSRKLK